MAALDAAIQKHIRSLNCRLDGRVKPGHDNRVTTTDRTMSDVETLKGEIKKLSAKALQAKMDLHDLSEELPVNWQHILSVAQRTHDAFATLEKKRAELKRLETA